MIHERTVKKYEVTFPANSDGEACDWVSCLLPLEVVQDWGYDCCGGEYIPPSSNGDGTYTATLWILPYEANQMLTGVVPEDGKAILERGEGVKDVKELASLVIEVPEEYEEGDFLYEVTKV